MCVGVGVGGGEGGGGVAKVDFMAAQLSPSASIVVQQLFVRSV